MHPLSVLLNQLYRDVTVPLYSGRFLRLLTLATTYFGHDLLWPRPTLATTYFGHGQADFGHGQADFGHCQDRNLATTFNLANLGRFWSGHGRCCPRMATRLGLADLGHGLADFWWPGRFWWGQAEFGQRDTPRALNPLCPGPPSAEPPSDGSPSAVYRPPPDRPPPDRPQFRAFFSVSRAHFHVFFSLSEGLHVSFFRSLGVFTWNFGGVLVGRDPQMCWFSPSGCPVNPPSGPHPSGPHPAGPHLGLGPHAFGPPPFGPPPVANPLFVPPPFGRQPFFFVWVTTPLGPQPSGPHPSGTDPSSRFAVPLRWRESMRPWPK